MTTENKIYTGIGIVSLFGIGFLFWKKKKEQAEQAAITQAVDVSFDTTPVIKIPSKATPTYTPTTQDVTTKESQVKPQREADTFVYSVGQKVMANGFNGTPVYAVLTKADGTHYTKGKLLKKIPFGKEIGTIKAVYKMQDGTRRYVVKTPDEKTIWGGNNGGILYWVPDVKLIKPFGKILPIKSVGQTVPDLYLDSKKVLKKGSKGEEVKKLQQILKIKVDGDFGTKTETALLRAKKVKQIRLIDFK